jgi:steroid delta-isomerase-like uncharacterized protein
MNMDKHETNDLIRRSIDAINNGDRLAFEGVFARECVVHDPSSPEDIRGIDGLQQFLDGYRAGFPDMHFELEGDVVVDGELCAHRWVCTGTHKAEFMGIAPTNQRITVRGMQIDQLRGGKVVETWQSWDTLGFLEQLGGVPALEQMHHAMH